MSDYGRSTKHFADELRQRCDTFLKLSVPDELTSHYAPGSLSDIIVWRCARDLEIDDELLELSEISVELYDDQIAKAKAADLKDYYADCQQLILELVNAPSNFVQARLSDV